MYLLVSDNNLVFSYDEDKGDDDDDDNNSNKRQTKAYQSIKGKNEAKQGKIN